MFRVSLSLGLIVICLTGAISAEVEIMKPIRDTGDEVALIFVTGGHIYPDQYKKTAQAIQEASDLRVWVALPEGSNLRMYGHYAVPSDVTNSIKALEKAGMKSENYIGVAHGQGGEFLHPYVEESKLKAVVFLGAVLPYTIQLEDFPVPILTLVAELDGYTRITRAMDEFAKLKNDMVDSFESLYRTPVILLQGSNHAQFATGKMTARVTNNDLKTGVTEDEAHRMIGKRVNSFLTATFSSSPSTVDSARADIEEAFYESFEKFQPFFTMKAFESDNFSNWTRMNQEYVAGEFADQIQVHTEIGENPWFFFSQPSISRGDDDQVVVEIQALVHNGQHNPEITAARQSAIEIDMKLKTKDAIWEALSNHDDGPHTSLRSEPMTCKALNEFAFQVALEHSSQEARDRYRWNRQIIFWKDTVSPSEALWGMSPLKYWEKKASFNVRGIAFSTDLKDLVNPGVLYCKVISPLRAMEWINVDSLKQQF